MKKILLIAVLILMYSCKEGNNPSKDGFFSFKEENNTAEKYDTITLGNRYSLLIPESLERTNELNDVARIQYQNKEEDFYIVVIDKLKEDFSKAIEDKKYNAKPNLEGYFKVIRQQFGPKTGIKNVNFSDVSKANIKNSKAITFTVTGETINDNNRSLFFRYSVVESNLRYYQIITWTGSANANKTIAKMNKIINSFQVEEVIKKS